MKEWTKNLPEDIYKRLCACKTKKKDLSTLVNGKWGAYKEEGKEKKGFTKEDALTAILELLESNSTPIDLTKEEYDELCN